MMVRPFALAVLKDDPITVTSTSGESFTVSHPRGQSNSEPTVTLGATTYHFKDQYGEPSKDLITDEAIIVVFYPTRIDLYQRFVGTTNSIRWRGVSKVINEGRVQTLPFCEEDRGFHNASNVTPFVSVERLTHLLDNTVAVDSSQVSRVRVHSRTFSQKEAKVLTSSVAQST